MFDSDPLPPGSEILFTLQAGEQDILLEGHRAAFTGSGRHGDSIHENLRRIEETVKNIYIRFGSGSEPDREGIALKVCYRRIWSV